MVVCVRVCSICCSLLAYRFFPLKPQPTVKVSSAAKFNAVRSLRVFCSMFAVSISAPIISVSDHCPCSLTSYFEFLYALTPLLLLLLLLSGKHQSLKSECCCKKACKNQQFLLVSAVLRSRRVAKLYIYVYHLVIPQRLPQQHCPEYGISTMTDRDMLLMLMLMLPLRLVRDRDKVSQRKRESAVLHRLFFCCCCTPPLPFPYLP